MKRVVISATGWATTLGNDPESVADSVHDVRTGLRPCPEIRQFGSPVKLAGWPDGFSFPSSDVLSWEFPDGLDIPTNALRSMNPHTVHGYYAVRQALEGAGWQSREIEDDRTGLFAASGGSPGVTHQSLSVIENSGAFRCPPTGIPAGVAGTLNFNLSSLLGIRGGSVGFTSACASSAHAIGYALDRIRGGKLDRAIVCGAEDLSWHVVLPFIALRSLSTETDPVAASCPFDRKRNGFVASGGGCALLLETLEEARARSAPILAELIGWGDSSDGYNVVSPDPEGKGIERAMRNALEDAGLQPEDVDYVNAHATSTPAGDLAEGRALLHLFSGSTSTRISSTKGLTGHGLSLSGALEAGITCLALNRGFYPVSAHLREPEPELEELNLIDTPVEGRPHIALSNSSGFGGSNVSLALRSFPHDT